MQCKARITLEKYKQKFGDGKHYFYPSLQCSEAVENGHIVCNKCGTDKGSEYREQGSRRFDHGVIDGPITPNSHIYGGEWYQANVKKYLEPSNATIIQLKQFQTNIEFGYKVNITNSILDTMPPKKRSVQSSVSLSQLSDRPQTPPPMKIKRKPAAAKQTGTIIAKFIERDMTEIIPDKVEHVIVSKFTHGSQSFYRDFTKDKIYKLESEGVVGVYIGRWDAVNSEIVRGVYNDSDSDTDSDK